MATVRLRLARAAAKEQRLEGSSAVMRRPEFRALAQTQKCFWVQAAQCKSRSGGNLEGQECVCALLKSIQKLK